MENLIPMYLLDSQGTPFLSYNVTDLPFKPARPFNHTGYGFNYATFLSNTLPVAHRATTIFSADLTPRDDVLLAILSLCLLLVIEGILTSVLLRTYEGNVSNFGFSIKQFIELARDFKVRGLIRGRPPADMQYRKNKINWKLLAIAISTLLLTFGVEIAVLYLSSPELTDVTNRVASFYYEEKLLPNWNEIRDNAGSAANRPCSAITIVSKGRGNIEQGRTRVTPCMTATGNLSSTEPLQKVEDEVELEFITDTHEFGEEHHLTIGEHSADYRTMIYFTLGDMRRKIMGKRSQFFTHQTGIFFIHQQFVAFLFNEYVRKTNDTRMNLERLTGLKFEHEVMDGENVVIAQINKQERFRKSISTRHIMRVRGILPRGPGALRFAIAFLKGSSGVSAKGPDLNDMDVGSSSTWAEERLMWQEESRRLNWLTLTILLGASLMLLAVLRYLLKPIGTAEIAGAYVIRQVGATPGRPVGVMGADEKSGFSLLTHRGTGFPGGTASSDSLSVGSGGAMMLVGHSNGTYGDGKR